jgi:hypothetical protein
MLPLSFEGVNRSILLIQNKVLYWTVKCDIFISVEDIILEWV